MNYVIAVRALCEFTARSGDLDMRFTPAPTASEGMAGHVTVAARRAKGYEVEVVLSGVYGDLTVRGRADGYASDENRLEEIKTYRGDLDAMPANHRALHWAQALVYGHLLCESRALTTLTVSLVYFDIRSEKETLLTQSHTAASLKTFFTVQCERFLAWAVQEDAHRQARNAALSGLAFPHAFRKGQRDIAVAVYRAARDGANLMVQAPTGIGKTLATLFPLLKACAEERIDRIFFLTAKTSGRALALDTVALLRGGAKGLPLRALELVARDKACEHPDKACHGDACPLARGFYDRLADARAAALEHGQLTREVVRETALAHDVCPYYLAQELARWSDVVVGDYNYYFDSSALLFGLTQAYQWQVAVLVDEAHNLVDRARGMYSTALDQTVLREIRAKAPAILKKPLDRLNRAWNAINRVQQEDYQVHETIPQPLLAAVQNLVEVASDHMAQAPLEVPPAALRFYFDVMHFASLAEGFGKHAIFDVMLSPRDRDNAGAHVHLPRQGAASRPLEATTLSVRNVVPAPYLATRFVAARATVLFSGTLAPGQFYRDTLGLAEGTEWLEVEGPFRAGQLRVEVVGHVSTRWRDRQRSLLPITDVIAGQYRAHPGNYLAFFSSFDYLQRVVETMALRHPDLPMWAQTPGMNEAARDSFLNRFQIDGRGIGFAVLGGAFAEGVDLAGERLIGAFVATLGLPQMNPVNEQMRASLEQRFGRGYDYAYLFPGLQKVVQAAGRVIRTEQDRGVVFLIDDRYRRADVRRLLPRWWHVPR
ncbi:ATP-dependent DNA helicase [Robbsia andropogonis]|uniref:ATP-dependent DNA helicase n=1 Tax=Robbsia andropogonis TaxID=28092 RepID=A0A0F5K170_9BURK|nr:ATP-dependent DNA helicase [Robbsia andropogonis]KKB63665.1 ATP-dependent DNA helicase [Robbsia andropogonis]MCP1119332.1 ATP-dependent DNA helicase [Robbsia andropogonis]MCP1129172.1 ATP-dependent DNA helicase [Robbsia andropogonis]